MSRKGNCWENKRSAVSRAVRREGEARHNASTGSFWRRLKSASVHGHKFATREPAWQAVLDWVAFYTITAGRTRRWAISARCKTLVRGAA